MGLHVPELGKSRADRPPALGWWGGNTTLIVIVRA